MPFVSLLIALVLILEALRMGEMVFVQGLLRHWTVFQYGSHCCCYNHHYSSMPVMKQMLYSKRRKYEENSEQRNINRPPERPHFVMRQFQDLNRERAQKMDKNGIIRHPTPNEEAAVESSYLHEQNQTTTIASSKTAETQEKIKFLESKVSGAMDSFLEGSFDHFSDSSPFPVLGQNPREVVTNVLQSLQVCDEPVKHHGPAVTLKFCEPLSFNEKLKPNESAWRELVRRSPTPQMFANRIRTSPFMAMLEWNEAEMILCGDDDTSCSRMPSTSLNKPHNMVIEEVESESQRHFPRRPLVENEIEVLLTVHSDPLYVKQRLVWLKFCLKQYTRRKQREILPFPQTSTIEAEPMTGVWLIHDIVVLKDSLQSELNRVQARLLDHPMQKMKRSAHMNAILQDSEKCSAQRQFGAMDEIISKMLMDADEELIMNKLVNIALKPIKGNVRMDRDDDALGENKRRRTGMD